jgi:hypothetical protein
MIFLLSNAYYFLTTIMSICIIYLSDFVNYSGNTQSQQDDNQPN